LEGGIRVPAVMWWKGIIEKEKSNQFFFVQDVLPTLLTAANIKTSDKDKFDGDDKWSNLLTGQIVPPKNAFVGARIISDERALFNNQWKLYSVKPVLVPVSASYQLFNIIDDPFEQNDLAEERPEIFNAMKKTITSYIERDVVGNMNPAHAYLHGDDRQGGVELGSPWMDGNYELNNPPSAVTSFFIFLWILIQAFKYQLATAFLFILLIFYAFKKLRQQ
jgi:arylsulfatase A-like enzyme